MRLNFFLFISNTANQLLKIAFFMNEFIEVLEMNLILNPYNS